MIRSHLITVVVATCLLAGLAGCASRPYYSDLPEPSARAPVTRASAAPSGVNSYVVKAGDTLHSIAFAAGTDWQTLATLNRIAAPYTIYPGQLLKLSASSVPVTLGMDPDVPAAAPSRAPAPPEPGARGSAAAQSPSVAPVPQPVPSQLPAGATPAPRPLPPPPSIPGGWQWPSAGKLVLGYANSAQPHKGIDIAGNTGDPVVAAKGGTVVYAGNGVRGYGNLLIVKHDALFLSAYAHNSKLLVREGDVVKGGQQIAEMGDSGTDRTKLHFEVRKQGNPVDPLQVLPRR
ncbi:MAG: peptidoglycan DD-metalloendopeptidase family protein [Pseudomonadales bacterium]|nr:peptidoglycan DD-metalloendopeptidase family protein [Pseudomonadales bacterium]MBP9032914.1 peptidoglycan DD-metalloendopeptidase family protein [Pseudomonadales bacterium]